MWHDRTDSIVLGSWVNTRDVRYLRYWNRSGLLALMLAQKTFNTILSLPWRLNLQIVKRVTTFKSPNLAPVCLIEMTLNFSASIPYDLIISNPLYYKGMHKQQHNLIDPNQAESAPVRNNICLINS